MPRAKRKQESVDVEKSPRETPEDNDSQDREGNQAAEKPSNRRQKHKSRPSLEPYVPRPQRFVHPAGINAISQSATPNSGEKSSGKGQDKQREHHHEDNSAQKGDDENHLLCGESSVVKDPPERSKMSPNQLDIGDKDIKMSNEKYSDHQKSKRKYRSKDKDGRDVANSVSKERKVKLHSKHKKPQIKGNSQSEDKQDCVALSDDCGEAKHQASSSEFKQSVTTAASRNTLEKEIMTTAEAHEASLDVEGNMPNIVCDDVEAMDHVSSDVDMKSATYCRLEEKEVEIVRNQTSVRQVDAFKCVAQTDSQEDFGAADVGSSRLHQNFDSDEKNHFSGDDVEVGSSRIDSELPPTEDVVTKECKHSGHVMKDKVDDRDGQETKDRSEIAAPSNNDVVCGERISEDMEVDIDLVEQGDCANPSSDPADVPEEKSIVDATSCCAEGELISHDAQLINSTEDTESHVAITDLATAISQVVDSEKNLSEMKANCQEVKKEFQTEDLRSCQSEIESGHFLAPETTQSETVAEDNPLEGSCGSDQLAINKSELKSPEIGQSGEEDSWDKLYDETGEALDSQLMEEVRGFYLTV